MYPIKKSIATFALLITFISVCLADDPGPDPGGDPDIPIDGGVGILLTATLIYGAKKIHDSSKENRQTHKQ